MRKDERLKTIYETVAPMITRSRAAWKEYLSFAAQFYKYSFDNTLLVYAQNPNVTMLATTSIWNRFYRYINKGETGIAVCEYDNAKLTIKHLFDISQTNGKGSIPLPWKMNEDIKKLVAERISFSYGIHNQSFDGCITNIVNQGVEQSFEHYMQDFQIDIRGHMFERLPQLGLEDEIKDIIEDSVRYIVFKRCGIMDKDENPNSFMTIEHFNTVPLVARLGFIVTDISKNILLEVEKTVKIIEKERSMMQNEQTELEYNRERRVEVSQYSDIEQSEERHRTSRQVWENGNAVSKGELSSEILATNDARYFNGEDASGGYGSGGETSIGDGTDDNKRSFTGDRGYDGEDKTPEQHQTSSRGDSYKRDSDEGQIAFTDFESSNEKEQNTQMEFMESQDSGSIFMGENMEPEFYKFRPAKRQPVFLADKELPMSFVQIDDIPRYNDDSVDEATGIELLNNTNGTVEKEMYDNAVPSKRENSSIVTHRTSQEKINYQYREEDNLYSGGQKTKYRNNVEAIKLLKRIEGENRLATHDEQIILARYVGWGGLSNAFNPNANGWENEYQELKYLLHDNEYEAARNSTITAYYTEPELIKHIYDTLGRFGFSGGKILDPAMGTGNFFSVISEEFTNSKLYGVEVDSITGRIAKQLYQKANIKVTGYETVDISDNSFDLAIGNIPFSNVKLYDKRYEIYDFLIHDYFIAKTIDKVKPGGIIAFITSKGTLDKRYPEVREYIAKRADLIGAVRLPNTAFKALAGTEVTADILFLQKRFKETDEMPYWVYIGQNSNYITMNKYFIEHPEMMLGIMKYDRSMYGNENTTTLEPFENQNLYDDLKQALSNLNAAFMTEADNEQIMEPDDEIEAETVKFIEAEEGTKNFTYVIRDDEIYYCENSRLYPQDIKGKKAERIKGLNDVRHALLEVIGVQTREYHPYELKDAQDKLNNVYDRFVKKNGYINDKANVAAFIDDDQMPLLRSIEDVLDDKVSYKKSPIFYKATIKSYTMPEKASSALEALEISLNLRMKVDIKYMAQLYPKEPDDIIRELGDKIFLNPSKYYGNYYEGWELDEEYLSGNVKDKLAYAKLKAEDNPELFSRNVEALAAVEPTPLLPSEIDFRIGSPWIPIEYYEGFMYETFGTAEYRQGNNGIELKYLEFSSTWRISNKNYEPESVKVNQTYGTHRVNAYEIYEDTLNLQSTTVRDPEMYYDASGNEQIRYVVNAKETMIARSKQQQIKEAFSSWLFKDKERTDILLKIYNDKFNNIRPREYDGSHLLFRGMSEELELRKHQKDVSARIIYSGTALMAHEVGAGKTAAMIASGMYLKNIGAIKKPIYIVPNHLTEQWANEFLRFFPSANVLVTTKKDFEKKSRQRFVSKIATGEYDAIIIGHSQFEKIPISKERQEKLLLDEINTISFMIDEMKREKGDKWSIKQMVIFQNNLKSRLDKLVNVSKKDDLLNFEQLGVDYMFVDEAHAYKNCFIFTKMRNISGIGRSSSQRAMDMLLKCQYLQEVNQGKGVVFATGTPISNSMSEMFIMQRYLQPQILKKLGLHLFDNWAATFGEVVSSLEINPEGSGYRMKNRFSKFHNLPELMSIFRQIADIQTADMLKLPVPEIEGGKANIIVTECSDFQKKIMNSFIERAEKIRNKEIDSSIDNMLKLTHEAKLMSIDPRLLYENAPNDPDSKLNQCINTVFEIWNSTKEQKLTQIIFCDSGTPKPGEFNVYDETKEQLVLKGLPENEVAFIHDAKTDIEREEMFEKVRKGEIRVLIGSTMKMGTGTNVQDLLIAVHHLDCPWRPADITQRDGRIIRQGNKNTVVMVNRYVTKGTFDGYLWQIQEQKLRYISQVMTGKSISRSCEDADETVLNAAEVKAIATANPLVAEKMEVDNEVLRLKLLKANWSNEKHTLQRNIEDNYPKTIAYCEEKIKNIKEDIELVSMSAGTDFNIIIDGKMYDERSKAGDALQVLAKISNLTRNEQFKVGAYKGLDVLLVRSSFDQIDIVLKGKSVYSTMLGDSGLGSIMRLENLVERIPGVLKSTEQRLSDALVQFDEAKREADRPFEFDEKLNQYLARQAEINAKLEFDELKNQDEILDESGAEEVEEAIEEIEVAI